VALFEALDIVFYQVCDMDQAVDFYSGVLGLTLLRREGRDWTEFDVGGSVLALSGELAVRPQGGGATAVLRTGDLDGLAARLAERSVQRGPVEQMGGARTLEFFDPDGNRLVAIEPDED
jgi:catechol 2,3-dioxygenase-like lactoylglutathione lyase family enzyme